ncbi:hypothetical protein E2C01_000778 [Portunus trituberculatus]|uniref:Uncharacterized protein n=1 Tax=Portunus trituberculatus TaxID=210409 RepID=A0A5B7CHH4_PORTR|nr:hypothetical protein [Portunus trituberculatus]
MKYGTLNIITSRVDIFTGQHDKIRRSLIHLFDLHELPQPPQTHLRALICYISTETYEGIKIVKNVVINLLTSIDPS